MVSGTKIKQAVNQSHFSLSFATKRPFLFLFTDYYLRWPKKPQLCRFVYQSQHLDITSPTKALQYIQ